MRPPRKTDDFSLSCNRGKADSRRTIVHINPNQSGSIGPMRRTSSANVLQIRKGKLQFRTSGPPRNRWAAVFGRQRGDCCMLYEAGNLKWKSRLDRLVGQVRLAQPPY